MARRAPPAAWTSVVPALCLLWILAPSHVQTRTDNSSDPGSRRDDGSIQCLSCLGVTMPHDCTHDVTCLDTEECFADKYVTDEGHVVFDLGCRGKLDCQAGPRPSRGRETRQAAFLCEECCRDQEFCNRHGCRSTDPVAIQCFSCPLVADPSHCETISTCNKGEVCFIQEVATPDLNLRFQMGCASSVVCQAAHLSPLQAGRCLSCCSRDFCNRKCPSL